MSEEMKDLMDKEREQGVKEGEKRGKEKTKNEFTLKLLKQGKNSAEEIASFVEITIDEVRRIASENGLAIV